MCLITRQKKAKILKKDLIIFKTVNVYNDVIQSVCQSHFKWIANKLEKVNLNIKSVHNTKDRFYTDEGTQKIYEKLSQCVSISEGFHAALTPDRPICIEWDYVEVKEFLIPAGSEVFYNATGLIVSNQMMML